MCCNDDVPGARLPQKVGNFRTISLLSYYFIIYVFDICG